MAKKPKQSIDDLRRAVQSDSAASKAIRESKAHPLPRVPYGRPVAPTEKMAAPKAVAKPKTVKRPAKTRRKP